MQLQKEDFGQGRDHYQGQPGNRESDGADVGATRVDVVVAARALYRHGGAGNNRRDGGRESNRWVQGLRGGKRSVKRILVLPTTMFASPVRCRAATGGS